MENTYETTDITLASVLRLNNIPLNHIDIQGSKGTFVFDDEPLVSNLVEQYNLGQIRVEPVAYHNMIRTMTTSVRNSI